MFTKSDQQFTDTAVDPFRRRLAITDLRRRRDILFWCACVLSICTLAVTFGSKPAGVGSAFAAAVQWILVFKFDSDLRLLSVIDRLAPR